MKKSDIAAIVLICSISLLISYFVMKSILNKPSQDSAVVKTIDKIDTNIIEPDKNLFNEKAINPTVEIIIGGNSDQ